MTKFHRTEPEWFAKAKHLPAGGSVRLGTSQKISFNGESYFLWDFRDNAGECYKPVLTLGERLAAKRKAFDANVAARSSTTPPLPAMKHPSDWPAAARVWLHKARFTNTDIMNLGAYWNPKLERVVVPFPLLNGDTAWVAREIEGDGPKYLFPKDFNRGGGAYWKGEGALIITEDALSAYRLHLDLGVSVLSLLGTSMDIYTKSKVATLYPSVYVWLDPDKAGQSAATKVVSGLGALGVNVHRVSSTRDPKLCTIEEINEALKEARCLS